MTRMSQSDVDTIDSSTAAGDEGLQARVARSYRTIVERYRAGDVEGALAVRNALRDELAWLIAQATVDAQSHLAAGRPADALGGFAEALELHRMNLADLDLSISVAATYDGVRTVYEALGQPLGAAAAMRLRT